MLTRVCVVYNKIDLTGAMRRVFHPHTTRPCAQVIPTVGQNALVLMI